MEIKIFTLLNVLFITCVSSLNLPADFKKCNATAPEFDECLSEAIEEAIKQLKEPKDKYLLPGLEPFQSPNDVVLQAGDPYTGVLLRESNFRLSGLTGITKSKASMDFETNTLKLELTFDEIQSLLDYEAHGKFLSLPIDASSTKTITLVKPKLTFIFKLGEYQKGDKVHYVILKSALDIEPESVRFAYDKLFENPELNEQMNEEMSKNWKKIFKEIGPQHRELYGQWFTRAFSNLLEKVPVSEMFDGIPKKVLPLSYFITPYYVPQRLI